MPIQVSFEIPDADLAYFRAVIRKAQDGARGRSEPAIIAAARRVAFDMRKRKLPEFVEQRERRGGQLLDLLPGSTAQAVPCREDSWRHREAIASNASHEKATFALAGDRTPCEARHRPCVTGSR